MKKLEIDFEEIGWFMQDSSRDLNDYYLNLKTGIAVAIQQDLICDIEEGDFDKLNDWYEEDEIDLAKDIVENEETWASIPAIESYEAYEFMVNFVNTIEDNSLIEKLNIALDGRGAFWRFKNVLSQYPKELERWYNFKQDKINNYIINWLNELGIEPIKTKLPKINLDKTTTA